MFYRTLLFLFLSLALARADEPVAPLPDFAGIYPTNATVPSIGLLASLAPGAKIVESKDKDVTVFRCDWPDVSVTIRVDPNWDQPHQIKEMNRWITYLSKEQKDNPIIKDLIKKLDSKELFWLHDHAALRSRRQGGRAAAGPDRQHRWSDLRASYLLRRGRKPHPRHRGRPRPDAIYEVDSPAQPRTEREDNRE